MALAQCSNRDAGAAETSGWKYESAWPGCEQRPVDERHRLVQDRGVARRLEISAGDVRQPQAVVRDPRAHPPTRRRMPPVLHVALGELAGRGPQELRPGQVRPGRRQRQAVLELVAEPVGAAGLVQGGPRPDPAGQRLVEQPAVEQDVHRAIGRPDLDVGHQVVPARPHRAQGRRVVGRSQAPDQLRGRARSFGLAQQDDHLRAPAVRQLEARLQRGAGIQAGPHGPPQPVPAAEPGGPIQGAVASQELRAVGRPGGLAPAEIEECHPARELRVPGVPGQDGTGGRVDGGHDVGRGYGTHGSEDPLRVGGHGQPPGAAGPVLDREDRDLHRVVDGRELDQVQAHPAPIVVEAAVAHPVPRHVRRVLEADREGRRAPHRAVLVVPDVDRLPGRIGHRVVGPRRELVLAAVPPPGVPGARLRDGEPEGLVGDDVEPRRRRGLPGAEDRDVLPAVVGEPAEAVEELELRARRRDLRPVGARGGRRRPGRDRPGRPLEPEHLVGQAAPPAQQDRPRRRLQQRPIVGRQVVPAQDVHPAPGARMLTAEGATGSSAPRSRARPGGPGHTRPRAR